MAHTPDPAEDAAVALLRPGQTTYHLKNLDGLKISDGSVFEMESKIQTKLLEGILQELQEMKELLEDIASMR